MRPAAKLSTRPEYYSAQCMGGLIPDAREGKGSIQATGHADAGMLVDVVTTQRSAMQRPRTAVRIPRRDKELALPSSVQPRRASGVPAILL